MNVPKIPPIGTTGKSAPALLVLVDAALPPERGLLEPVAAGPVVIVLLLLLLLPPMLEPLPPLVPVDSVPLPESAVVEMTEPLSVGLGKSVAILLPPLQMESTEVNSAGRTPGQYEE
jgi:hypothetical protein